MSSNSFHNLIDFDIVHYFFELTRRITTMNDKIHAIELNHFIKLFFYSIQNRDSTFSFQAASSCEHNEKTKYRNFENDWMIDWSCFIEFIFLRRLQYFDKNAILKILFWSERMLDFWKLIDVRKIYVRVENFSWKFCECVILLSEVFKWCFRWKFY